MSNVKFAAAKELISENRLFVARVLLETIDSPVASAWLDKLEHLRTQRLHAQILGLLDEWIRGNPEFQQTLDFMSRDATCYLRSRWMNELTVQKTFEELQERQGLNNLHLEQIAASGIDLSDSEVINSDFSRALLEGADFSNSNLMYSRFVGTELPDANFNGANLSEADLTRANLQRADMRNADLTWAVLSGADLQGAIFSSSTTMPDGSKWIANLDLSNFVNLH